MSKILQRYPGKFSVTDAGCWEWNLHRSNGYGKCRVNGKSLRVHRYSWELEHGPIPTGKYALHKCNNRACANPQHLYIGDHADNMRDLSRSGALLGERHNRARLTEKDVRWMRSDAAKLYNNKEIAKMLGVNRATVSYARRGHSWGHIAE